MQTECVYNVELNSCCVYTLQIHGDEVAPTKGIKVTGDFNDARQLGVTGTPTFFINGRRYQERDRSVDAIKKVINEQILKK